MTMQRTGSEGRYHDLYENMPVMYFEMDARGDVVSVNRFGAEQLGYEPSELIGNSVLNVFHEDDRADVEKQFGSLIETGGVASWEFRKRRKDRSVLWVRETARTIRTAEGAIEVMVVCQDITARKQAEEKGRAAERLVRELSLQVGEAQERERRRIAVHLHDDVGQSLVLAHIKLDQVAQRAGAEKEELLEVKKLIQQAINDTRTLTFDLASPVLYELGLAAALRSLCDHDEGEVPTNFVFECKEEIKNVPERISVSLYRIASELLFNIRKHAEAKEARVCLGRDADYLWLTVEDDGRGFDQDAVRSATGPSRGIGLFSVEQLVDLLGGEMRVDSEPGKGSTFSIRVRES